MNHKAEERRAVMPNNPYMFNGSRTAPARGGYRRRLSVRRKKNKQRTRKNRKYN